MTRRDALCSLMFCSAVLRSAIVAMTLHARAVAERVRRELIVGPLAIARASSSGLCMVWHEKHGHRPRVVGGLPEAGRLDEAVVLAARCADHPVRPEDVADEAGVASRNAFIVGDSRFLVG